MLIILKLMDLLIKDVLVSKGNENIITMIINFAKDQDDLKLLQSLYQVKRF